MKRIWKKTLGVMAFAALTAFVLTARSGQAAEDGVSGYPADAPIDVCAQEVVGYESLGGIDFTDASTTLDGWETCGDGVKLSRGEKTLKIHSDVEDPYIFTPMLPAFVSEENVAKTVGKILVKIRVRRENKGPGQIFYAQRDEPGYSEKNAYLYQLAKDHEFHDYVLPIDTKSPLLRLRFDVGGDYGDAEIEKFELVRVVYKPAKFGVQTIDEKGKLTFTLVNNTFELLLIDATYNGVHPKKSYPSATLEVADKAPVDVFFPQKKAFEEIDIVSTVRATKDTFLRRFFTFNPEVADKELANDVPTLKSDSVQVRFAPDASGAEILRNGKRVAVICPLFCEEGDGAAILPDDVDYSKVDTSAVPSVKANDESTRLMPVLRSIDPATGEAEFNICAVPVAQTIENLNKVAKELTEYDPFSPAPKLNVTAADRAVEPSSIVGSLKFRLDGDMLSFDYDSPRKIHAPVIRVLGEMQQAILSGSEYLEKGEHSSSTADIETKEHVRYAMPIDWTTAPFASIVTDLASVSLLYDNPKNQSIFAVPDFIDGDANSSRMNICSEQGSGKIRLADGCEPIEQAILWSVKTRGLPEPPTPPRTGVEEDEFLLAGLEKSAIKTPYGWMHAAFSEKPEPPYQFGPTWGGDYIATIWELSGKLPEVPEIVLGGGHMTYYNALLLMGRGQYLVDNLAGATKARIASMKPDGSFRYSGKYLRGGKYDYASGVSGNNTFGLMEYWRITKKQAALDAALKALEFENALKTPAGAQVWELSIHTPDIMGSSRCAMSNVLAYEATGEKKYLDAAVRWALTGIPFVYLWEDPDLTPGKQPMMRYATIAVFGATNWAAPNWMGRPVQWCGLDYARALLMLAPYDDTLDWKKIAEGIVASAECQLYDDQYYIGLLPDSFVLKSQEKQLCNINPTAVSMLRRWIDGKPTNAAVVDCAGHRVLSPYPARVDGNTILISAKKGTTYQIVIDGKEVRTIEESAGEDSISF